MGKGCLLLFGPMRLRLILISILLFGGGERRERVGSLDNPPEGEEGDAGEDGGAPGVGVPLAVLPDREPPLLPQRRRVRVRYLRRVRVLPASELRPKSSRFPIWSLIWGL